MIVIAVEYFNIDASLGQASRDFSQLSGFGLLQPQDDHLPLPYHPDRGTLERATSSVAIREEKMRHTFAVHNPRSSAFDAHAGSPQSVPHFR